MNISRKDIDANNAVLTINIEKNDYSDIVEKQLRDYRKKAKVPGFRPGMVPVGMLKKMYGKSILAEQINKLLTDTLYNYIDDNKINILGNPLPSENQTELDFDLQEDFEFSFDLGIAPDIKIEFSKNDKVPYYNIEVAKTAIDNVVHSYQMRYGLNKNVDFYSDGDMLQGNLFELDADGKMLEDNGIQVQHAKFYPKYTFKNDADAQKLFDGKKVGESVIFNPKQSIENKQELISLLNISSEQFENLTADFQFVIELITHMEDAQINQELFDKVFDKETIKTEEEFREKIRENIKANYVRDSDYKFSIDMREFLIKKYENLTFPEEFLKRWLKTRKETITDEEIDVEYPKLIKNVTWQLIQNQIVEENNIEVTEDDIKAEARKIGRAQFIRYGIYDIENEVIDNYVNDMLKRDDYVREMVSRIYQDKVIAAVRPQIKIENKKISLDNFNKFFEEMVNSELND